MADTETAALIKEACDAGIANPNFKPLMDENGGVVKTFCNMFVQSVCHAVGYNGLDNMMANQIVDYLASAKEWSVTDASKAAIAASQGVLVIACHKYTPHGHVNIVYPSGGLVYSGHWSADVPICANVGKDNKIGGANFFFPVADTQPLYYIWNRRQDGDEEDGSPL